MIGTKSVPPPMPAGTATMPMRKQVTNRASGQNHHGIALPGTALSPANARSGSMNNQPQATQAFKTGINDAGVNRGMVDRIQEMVW